MALWQGWATTRKKRFIRFIAVVVFAVLFGALVIGLPVFVKQRAAREVKEATSKRDTAVSKMVVDFNNGVTELQGYQSLMTTSNGPVLTKTLNALRGMWEVREDYPKLRPKDALKKFLTATKDRYFWLDERQQIGKLCELMGEKSPYPILPTFNPWAQENLTGDFMDNWEKVEQWTKDNGRRDGQYLFCDQPVVQGSFTAFRKMIDRGDSKDKLRKLYKVRIYRYWAELVEQGYFDADDPVCIKTENQIKGFAKDLGLKYVRPLSTYERLQALRKSWIEKGKKTAVYKFRTNMTALETSGTPKPGQVHIVDSRNPWYQDAVAALNEMVDKDQGNWRGSALRFFRFTEGIPWKEEEADREYLQLLNKVEALGYKLPDYYYRGE